MHKVVVFQLCNEQYAIPVEHVVSIEKMSHPTLIPSMPSYMLGVVRIRGELVPVLDTSQILYRRPYAETEKNAACRRTYGRFTCRVHRRRCKRDY